MFSEIIGEDIIFGTKLEPELGLIQADPIPDDAPLPDLPAVISSSPRVFLSNGLKRINT